MGFAQRRRRHSTTHKRTAGRCFLVSLFLATTAASALWAFPALAAATASPSSIPNTRCIYSCEDKGYFLASKSVSGANTCLGTGGSCAWVGLASFAAWACQQIFFFPLFYTYCYPLVQTVHRRVVQLLPFRFAETIYRMPSGASPGHLGLVLRGMEDSRRETPCGELSGAYKLSQGAGRRLELWQGGL